MRIRPGAHRAPTASSAHLPARPGRHLFFTAVAPSSQGPPPLHGETEFTGLMVATRAILPGDEITYDYCTSEDCELSPSWDCHCGASNCRRRVTPTDWSLPELQQRYRGHFLPHIAAKIAEVQASRGCHVEPEPLCAIDRDDSRGTWWLRLSEPAESVDAEFRGVGPSQARPSEPMPRGRGCVKQAD